jgi:hypothetical protein
MFVVVSVAGALASVERSAVAYCRTTTCQDTNGNSYTGHRCYNPTQPDDCGVEIGWRQPCVSFDVQKDASVQVDYTSADLALKSAFAAWTGAACGAASPSIQAYDFGSVDCTKVQYNYDNGEGNANILIFRDKSWPHSKGSAQGSADIIALTTVTFDPVKGDIFDADIEVNSANFELTVTPSTTAIDLQSVLTHEAGHFLGLAHTQDTGATMYPDYSAGTVGKRTPDTDDVACICEAYPPDRTITEACTGIPLHGWASQCAGQQPNVSCEMAVGPAPHAPFQGVWGLCAVTAVARALRRRSALQPGGCVKGRTARRRS